MKTSEEGLDFIRGFESYMKEQPDGTCRAYQCQAGRWTCGWGCTEGVTATTHWTLEEAKERFATEMAKHEAAVNSTVKVPISQSQFDALVSFSYNCGTGAVPSIIKLLNKGNVKASAAKFSEYNKYTDPETKKKLVSRGLVRRRAAETAIFLKEEEIGPIPQSVASPDKTMTLKTAALKVAAPVAAITATASPAVAPALPSLPIPSVPDSITTSLTNLDTWKHAGEHAWTLLSFANAQPLLSAGVGISLAAVWLWPRPKAGP